MRFEENIRALCLIPGVSGNEGAVRAYLQKKLEGCAGIQTKVDPLGNLLVEKQGAQRAKNKVLFAAHMDEVGLIVTHITEKGYLHFAKVGGIDDKVLIGKRVRIGKNAVPGVIGTKPIHLQSQEERGKVIASDKLFIDIGARDKEEAEQVVSLGDYASFDGVYHALGENLIKCKALDDRVGCAVLLELILSELPYDMTFLFSVQEEVGLRGARVGAYTAAPDIAVAIETTTAADIDGVEKKDQVCWLGKGAAVPFMDGATIYSRALYDLAFDLAREQKIPCQTKHRIAGGNDCGVMSTVRGGARTLAVSVPCRNLHSPACVMHKEDAKAVLALAAALAKVLPAL